ncbi:uncharacterized protein LOC126797022 [Argentina anserina]|uniref:uncharacterized protein LOC126797022 n=1 Tax=Argentina anserina TaxID=57926 RepID=UPI00217689DA|nr:uncharacterized protein LOC126797022 [Potentilla anserina]
MLMEMAASKAKNKSSNVKVSLEDYLLLLQSGSHHHLTVAHLNQIINMHGYKKIHKVQKKLLSDAVNSLDLVSPCRSTLHDYVSPPVTTKVEDVMADLTNINWQECCITSIDTRSSNQSPARRTGAVPFQQYSPPAAPVSAAYSAILSAPAPSKKRSVRKRKRTAQVADLVNFPFL